MTDPIVAAVRKAREEHERECGNSLDAIVADFRRKEREEAKTQMVVSRPPRNLSR